MNIKKFIEEQIEEASNLFEEADNIRTKHITAGETLTCDYFVHWTREWEYHRGQVNSLLKIQKLLGD